MGSAFRSLVVASRFACIFAFATTALSLEVEAPSEGFLEHEATPFEEEWSRAFEDRVHLPESFGKLNGHLVLRIEEKLLSEGARSAFELAPNGMMTFFEKSEGDVIVTYRSSSKQYYSEEIYENRIPERLQQALTNGQSKDVIVDGRLYPQAKDFLSDGNTLLLNNHRLVHVRKDQDGLSLDMRDGLRVSINEDISDIVALDSQLTASVLSHDYIFISAFGPLDAGRTAEYSRVSGTKVTSISKLLDKNGQLKLGHIKNTTVVMVGRIEKGNYLLRGSRTAQISLDDLSKSVTRGGNSLVALGCSSYYCGAKAEATGYKKPVFSGDMVQRLNDASHAKEWGEFLRRLGKKDSEFFITATRLSDLMETMKIEPKPLRTPVSDEMGIREYATMSHKSNREVATHAQITEVNVSWPRPGIAGTSVSSPLPLDPYAKQTADKPVRGMTVESPASDIAVSHGPLQQRAYVYRAGISADDTVPLIITLGALVFWVWSAVRKLTR